LIGDVEFANCCSSQRYCSLAVSGGLHKAPSVVDASTHTLNALAEVGGIAKAQVKLARAERVAYNMAAYEATFGAEATAGMGSAGKRLVTGRALPAEIAAVHPGVQISEPVRVFVGKAEGATSKERVDLAVSRLAASGGLDKRDILVLVPNAMGDFLPQVPFAQEVMSKGDTATVVVQSVATRPWFVIQDIKSVGVEQRALIRGITAEMTARGREPGTYRILVDGHCYGALTTSAAIAEGGLAGVRQLGIDGALLTAGPLGWMPQRRALEATRAQGASVVHDVAELDALHAAGDTSSLTWAQHRDDPMRIRLGDLWRPMTDANGVRLPGPHVPVVSAMASVFDLAAYGTRPGGQLVDVGHDFRGMSTRGVRAAFHHAEVTDAQVALIEGMNARDEALKTVSGSRSRM